MTNIEKINAAQNYSNGQTLQAGMQVKDAYSDKNLFEEFQQADVDKNGKLSAEEITLYDKKQEVKDLKQKKSVLQAKNKDERKMYATVGAFCLAAATFLLAPAIIPGAAIGACAVGTVVGVYGAPVFGLLYIGASMRMRKTEKECNKQLKQLETQIAKDTDKILDKAKETDEKSITKVDKSSKSELECEKYIRLISPKNSELYEKLAKKAADNLLLQTN